MDRLGPGVEPGGAPAASEDADPEALVVTHCFNSGDDGGPYSAIVRLTGRRVGVAGARSPSDSFSQEDRVERVMPGSGPVSITSWVYGLRPGEWAVEAELLSLDGDARRGRRVAAQPIRSAAWSWRHWAVSPGPSAPVTTRWALLAPLARIPGVIPGSWPALGTLGALVALLSLAVILQHKNLAIGQSAIVFVVALAGGLAGAKLWYAALHPGPWRQAILGGWAVDGFLVVAPVSAIATLLAMGLPAGAFLDSAAPGLFLAVAVGRIGCFLTGCCAGRVTRSRWGIWSSDRRVGARRIPAQLVESAAGLLIGSVAAALVLGHAPHIDGTIFAGALAAYVVVRQALLRVRAERREFSWRRRSTAVA
jgi:phosphatidylglycerol:prolipoprotein diacylglycerol transferase